MGTPRHPSLYQINTRVWLTALARSLGRPATLDDIPDAALDGLARMGFDWIWLLSVWQTGAAGQRVSRATRSGGTNSRTRCRISARPTSRDLASPSPGTTSMINWEAMRRWCASATVSAYAVSACCSISFRLSRPVIVWNSIGVLTNSGTIWAYWNFAHGERETLTGRENHGER
jgi:hypothetical protein